MEVPRIRVLDLRKVVPLLAVVPTVVWWLERVVALPARGWFSGRTTVAIGGDFLTFHTAANLVATGRGDIIYDPALFQSVLGPEYAYGPFGNPPPFLLVFAPLGRLPFEPAWLIWTGVSLVGLAVALKALGVRRWLAGAAAALLFPPVYFALTFGQPSVLWLLIMVAVYVLLKRGQSVAGGAVAGLLIMKPPLAVGFAIWWLVDWRRYRSAVAAAFGTAGASLAISYAVFAETWTGYWGSVDAFLRQRGSPVNLWAHFSAWSFWDLLMPDFRLIASVLGAASTIAIVAVGVRLLRSGPKLEVAMSISVLLTVLGAPHLLAYDWTLLLIPGVLLWKASSAGESRHLAYSAVVAASGWSVIWTIELIRDHHPAIQVAPLVLLLAILNQRGALIDHADSAVEGSGAAAPASHLLLSHGRD